MDIRKGLSKLFNTTDNAVEPNKKIYVGNGRLSEKNSNITLDITELLNHEQYFREAIVSGEPHYEVDITILPFRKGMNKFGNTHYLIIKNK